MEPIKKLEIQQLEEGHVSATGIAPAGGLKGYIQLACGLNGIFHQKEDYWDIFNQQGQVPQNLD